MPYRCNESCRRLTDAGFIEDGQDFVNGIIDGKVFMLQSMKEYMKRNVVERRTTPPLPA